ncbi:MAG TPA: hypothetical protein VJB34_06305, partial [Bdellovibrionota bacterium]|nr:hypothetical protein [Bdellovibrionota bacterium]
MPKRDEILKGLQQAGVYFADEGYEAANRIFAAVFIYCAAKNRDDWKDFCRDIDEKKVEEVGQYYAQFT